MVAEQLIFTIISFSIFVYMFFYMIKKNDTTYVSILVLEALGIFLNFWEVIFKQGLSAFFVFIKYILAIIIPVVIIILERKNIINLFESWNILKAKIAKITKNYKLEKQALLSVISKNPNSHTAHRMLAEMYEDEGGLRKAIDEYVQAVDINKKDYDSYYKVANLLNAMDRKEEAAEMLFNLVNKKPDMYEASLLLGDILIQTEKYKEAANIYQEALRYNPMSYELNYNLGIAYTMLNDFQSAKTCYEKAADINSLAYNSKYSLAQIALIYKDLEEAERRFLEAIEDEALSADGYYELSKISLIKGNKEIAIKYANQAVELDAKNISKKVKKDPIFIPILARIQIPFNLENTDNDEKEKKELELKEVRVKEHLEQTVELTRQLSYNDIKMLKHNSKQKQNKIEKEKMENQKEINY